MHRKEGQSVERKRFPAANLLDFPLQRRRYSAATALLWPSAAHVVIIWKEVISTLATTVLSAKTITKLRMLTLYTKSYTLDDAFRKCLTSYVQIFMAK